MDPYAPFVVIAAMAAVGAFAVSGPRVQEPWRLASAATEPARAVGGISYAPEPAPPTLGVSVMGRMTGALPPNAAFTIVERARLEVTNGVRYDATYRLLNGYPGGDVPPDRGACTDVVVRSFRAVGVDLQVLVYEDVASDPDFYRADPDPNVDHRRVTTLYSYFARHTASLPTKPRTDASSFLPGDVVFYAYKRCYTRYPCVPEHVAIVSDRIGPRGLPLVLQNGGPVAKESDSLDHGTVVGHYRFPTLAP
jgi:uncharacterized protein YijF (DUF1287 family)